MKSFYNSEKLDQWGMFASISCAIHCATLPLIATALPLLGLEFLANVWVEIIMILISLILGTWSLLVSIKEHKNILPIFTLVAGFMSISTGHFLWHDVESILVPLGGFTIAAAHFLNWKFVRTCSFKIKSNDDIEPQ